MERRRASQAFRIKVLLSLRELSRLTFWMSSAGV